MKRLFAVLLAIGISAIVASGQIEAQSKPGSGSSKPSTGSSSSKPSTGSSKPSTGSSSSKPSTGSSSSKPSTPPSSGGSVKPSTPPSTGGSTKPGTTPSVKPGTSDTKPSVRPDAPKKEEPKTGPSIRPGAAPSGTTKKDEKDTPKPSVRPGAGGATPTGPPGKPINPKSVGGKTYDDAAAAAAARAKSKENFQKAQAAKPEYTDPKGKVVKIDPVAPSTTAVRNKLDADTYRTRTVRVEHHYHHTYGPRYSYYCNQPYVYVGGGYSPLFYYAMLDWSLERRAAWYYHNQHVMDQALYQRSLAENAQLRLEIEKMKTRGVAINTGYVDSEFADNPDLMYTQEHIDAVYNPVEDDEPTVHVHHHHGDGSGGLVVLWVLIGILVVITIVYLVFIKNWKE